MVTDVVSGDFENCRKSQPDITTYYYRPTGNVMWRSLEMQTGHLIYPPSDIYVSGLVVGVPSILLSAPIKMHWFLTLIQCLYVYGKGDYLIPEDWNALAQEEINPQNEILVRHLCFFGPTLSPEFLSLLHSK